MTEEVNHLEENQQSIEENQQPIEEVKQPIEETQTPIEEAQTPIEETQTPIEEAQTPIEEAQTPIEETPQSIEETQTPIEEAQTPIEETPQSIEETQTVENIPISEETVSTEEDQLSEPVQNTEEERQETEYVETTQPKKYIRESKLKIVPNTDDFNWDELDKDQQIYSEAEQKQMEDIYSQTFSAIVEQEVVEGTIVAKNSREVVVNIGFKSDGIIPANELRYLTDVKIGDKIDVYVESQEDAAGQLILSHKKAQLLKSWSRVNLAHENSEVITGYIKSKTKGGLIVDVFGIEAFLPGSQIDVKPIRDYDVFVDKTMEFKVVKINNEFKNVVVSHKALIESELEAQRSEIMAGLEKGQVLEGIVKNITNYGAFVDLGGVDGLIHITDISWGRITDPKEVLELDQKINVVILDFDESKKRIALGLKQLTPHPWDALDPELKVGDKVTGKVVVLADYGAFIEVLQGVEGLIHVSEMSWSQHLRTAQEFLSIGQVVDAIILTLDREERKMSLGIKQLIPDPWISIVERFPVNSRHTAIVRNFTNFGIFVELEEGVGGLIHISDLSWSKKIKHPAEFTKIGEEIEVIILDTDMENRRLSLGHKQLTENPWDIFESIYTVGSIHQGTVSHQNEKGVIINLQGVEGFAFFRGLQREDGSMIKNGETEDFKVLDFTKDGKKIIVSHTRIWQDLRDAEREANEEKEKRNAKDTSRTVKRISDNIEKSTLGDLDALINLKADLEMAESKNVEKETAKKKRKETKVDTDTDVQVDTETKAEVETEVEAETETKAEVEAEVEAETETKAEVETEVEAETETKAEVETEVEAETETKAEVEAEVEAETETKAETETEVEAETEIKAEVETEVEAETEVKVDTETKAETEQEPLKETLEEKPKKTRAKREPKKKSSEEDSSTDDSVVAKPKKTRAKKDDKNE